MANTKKNKNIKLQGDSWSIKAVAVGIPTRDIAITLKIKYHLRQSEVEAKESLMREIINDWWMDSNKMDPRHFIIDISSPKSYKDDSINPVYLIADISVLSRKTIDAGFVDGNLVDYFTDELIRLKDNFGLE